MYLREIGWEGVVSFHLTQDRYQWRSFVITAINSGSIKGGEFLEKLSVY